MKISHQIRPMAAAAAAAVALAADRVAAAARAGRRRRPSGTVTHVAGAPSWCGTKKISFAPARRLRRQQLAAGHDGLRQGGGRQVPERHELQVRRRPGQHPEGHLRHQGHGRQGRQRDGRLPRRGQGDAPRAAQRLQGRRRHGALPRRPRRQGRRQLRQVGRRRLRHTTARTGRNWIKKNLPDGGNILFLCGPAGNSQGIDRVQGAA